MTDGDARVGCDPLAAVEQAAIFEEVLSALRHDLRNKFSAIRCAAFYLTKRLGKTELWNTEPRLPEMSQIIDQELTAANGLLDDPFALARLRPRAVAVHDAAACVRRAVSCMRRAPAVRVEVDVEPGKLEVDADELSLAVRNLLENAAEASGGDGVVRVSAAYAGEHYAIQVDDDGPGIAPADRELVFQPFQSTKPGHTGLGLNIVRRIAQRYTADVLVGERAPGASLSLKFRRLNGV